MERDNEPNFVSKAGKSFSAPGFQRKELDDEDGKMESLFPPFFMQLPSELKLKILDSVSGVDIAKVSCVCWELRCLASNDDLWKQKYVSQFGNYKDSGIEGSFKKIFVKDWKGRKSLSEELSSNNMRRNRFNPFGEDEDEWLNIARLCMGVGVPQLRNGMSM